MYGGTSAGVDLILREYLALWAFVMNRIDDFDQAANSELERQNCDSANFSTRYQLNHPTASEDQIVEYVVRCWQTIAWAMKVPIE